MSDMEKDEFVPAALPTEIPDPPDLSKVPVSVIHSATVESLISQTEDLSARLKVQIRRNAVLERKALDHEEENTSIKKEIESLQHQHELYNEKATSQREKIHDLHTEIEQSTKELELLEVRYTELSGIKEEDEKRFNDKIKTLSETIEELEELLPLKEQNVELSDDLKVMKQRVSEFTEHLQTKEDEMNSLKKDLNHKQEKLAHSEGQIIQLQNQINQYLNIREEKVELENLLILRDREKQQLEQQVNNDTVVFRKETQNLRALAKTLQTEKNQMLEQMDANKQEVSQLHSDKGELQGQLENLQQLWYRMQAELEKEKTKNMALNKLNKELAHQVQNMQTTPEAQEEYYRRYILKNKDLTV